MALIRRSAVRKVAMPIGRPPRLQTLEREARKRVEEILAKQAKALGIEIETLVQRLGPGRLEVLLEEIDWEGAWEQPLVDEMRDLLRNQMVRVGTPELHRLGLDPQASFNLLNERALRHAQEYVPELVREVTDSTKDAIRARVAAGFEEGKTTRQIARQIRDVVGLTEHQMGPVLALQAEGKDAAATKLQERLIRQRAQMIADTETIRAFNEGQQQAWEAGAEEGFITPSEAKRFWVVAASRRVGGRACDICSEIAGMNNEGVGLNEGFTMPDGSTLMSPPAHPRCRCGVRLRFR